MISLRPYVVGDSINNSEFVMDAKGDSISLSNLVSAEEYVFLFIWRRSCPHCIRLLDLLNEDLQTRGAYRHKVVAINDEAKLSREDRLEIQSEMGFSCYFYDQKVSNDLMDKFWVKFSPFGVILKDGKIIRLACHFDDFTEFVK